MLQAQLFCGQTRALAKCSISITRCNPHCSSNTGGGTLESAWRQLLADVLRVPLHVVIVAAASARGAAMLAGIGIDLFQRSEATNPATTAMTQPQPIDSYSNFQLRKPQLFFEKPR